MFGKRVAKAIIAVILAGAITGCGSGPPMSPADRFDAQHAGKTMTPYGLILSGSIDTEDGKVICETSQHVKLLVRLKSNNEVEVLEIISDGKPTSSSFSSSRGHTNRRLLHWPLCWC